MKKSIFLRYKFWPKPKFCQNSNSQTFTNWPWCVSCDRGRPQISTILDPLFSPDLSAADPLSTWLTNPSYEIWNPNCPLGIGRVKTTILDSVAGGYNPWLPRETQSSRVIRSVRSDWDFRLSCKNGVSGIRLDINHLEMFLKIWRCFWKFRDFQKEIENLEIFKKKSKI